MMNPKESAADSSGGFTIESSEAPPGAEGEPKVPAGPDWTGIRRAYEHERETRVIDICRRFGITQATLRYRIDREDWPLRRVPKPRFGPAQPAMPTRKQLVGRLMRLLERHVSKLENENVTPTDKEATLLGNASRTMTKLIQLGDRRDPAGSASTSPESREMARLRKKIAERIEQLNQG